MASETSSDSETEDMPALEGLANVGQPLRHPAHTPGGGTRRLLDAPQHEEVHGAGVAAPEGGRPAGGRALLLLHPQLQGRCIKPDYTAHASAGGAIVT